MNTLVHPSPARQGSTPVDVAPDLDWLDRVTGRAAVDPAYRELLLNRPAAALGGEELPTGLLTALTGIRARDLSEYARLAIETEAAYSSRGPTARREELVEVRDPAVAAPVGAAA